MTILAKLLIPDANGEHVKKLSSLDPAEKHDNADDAEGVER